MKKQIFKIEETEGKRLLKIVQHSYGVFLVFDDSFLNIHARHDYDGDIEYEFDDEINDITNVLDKKLAIKSTIVDSIEWDKLYSIEWDKLYSIKSAERMKKNEKLDRHEWMEYQRLRAKHES